MKRTIAVLTLTAGLALSCSPALAMGEDCTTTTETVTVEISPAVPAVPAVPPVYETVTEYEFEHRNADLNGGIKWQTDPEWNAEGNPNSIGWFATGNTRQVSTGVVLIPGVDGVPAVDAVYATKEIPVTTCKPVPDPVVEEPVTEPEPALTPEPEVIQEDDPRWDCATMGNKVCGPVADTPAPPAETAVRTADVAPLASVGAEQPEELAYTGASDWVLPAGLGLLAGGAALMVVRRRLA